MKKTYLEEVEEKERLAKIGPAPSFPPCRIIKEDVTVEIPFWVCVFCFSLIITSIFFFLVAFGII